MTTGLLLSFPRPVRADTPKTVTAQKDYRAAYDEMGKGNWSEARRLLLALWAGTKSYDVAASLGQVEFKLEHFGLSARYTAFALANVPPSEKPAFVDRLRAGLKELRPRVAAIQVSVSEPGAAVSVDGEELAIPLGSEVFLDPGKHIVSALKDDRTASAEIHVEAGGTADVRLELRPATSPISTVNSPNELLGSSKIPSDSSRDEDTRPNVVYGVVGGAVALGAVATGIGLRVAGGRDYDRADSLQLKNGAHGCSIGSALANDCAAQRSANQAGDRKIDLSTAVLVVASATLAGTAAYWFWPREPQKSQASQVRIQADVSRSSGFMGLSYDF